MSSSKNTNHDKDDEWEQSFKGEETYEGKVIKGKFVCIDAVCRKYGNVDSIAMSLEASDSENSFSLSGYANKVIRFFNCSIGTKRNVRVQVNSDFAKLYRLTFGINPEKRFGKSQQLVKHFKGEVFDCVCVFYGAKSGTRYWKVRDIRPLAPIMSEDWTEYGAILKKTNINLKKKSKRNSYLINKSEVIHLKKKDETDEQFHERIIEQTLV